MKKTGCLPLVLPLFRLSVVVVLVMVVVVVTVVIMAAVVVVVTRIWQNTRQRF